MEPFKVIVSNKNRSGDVSEALREFEGSCNTRHAHDAKAMRELSGVLDSFVQRLSAEIDVMFEAYRASRRQILTRLRSFRGGDSDDD